MWTTSPCGSLSTRSLCVRVHVIFMHTYLMCAATSSRVTRLKTTYRAGANKVCCHRCTCSYKAITIFSLIRTRGSYFFSAPLPCATNGDCAIIGDHAIIISGRQFDIFCNISAHQMLRNVHCTHHTLGICRHMNSCHAPCTLYNM